MHSGQNLRELPPGRLPCRRAQLAGCDGDPAVRVYCFPVGFNLVDDIEIESPHQAALQ
ncbi:hypothetical protein [Dickeya zeae]|uniref:hypothetical protein n=1 Tax=Dickeya zeae TaxID=204042 RepID=UPI001C62C857|nr:hypothetical protein [Dickeya zeae]MCA6985410.1 hypothetical protein [Dickeya zeae]MCO7262822.1 hypothetical protein [Dickeya zeae]